MQLHQIQPSHKRKTRKRVGRGGKRGTYSGKGQKGQKSRSNPRFEPIIRGLIKRYPKLKGYRIRSRVLKPTVINISILDREFESGDNVNPEMLLKKGLISKMKGRTNKVKILGHGEINKALNITNCEISKQAKEKVEKAKGTVEPMPSKIDTFSLKKKIKK